MSETLPPLINYTGHYCRTCGYWRCGQDISFLESERLHRMNMKCPASLETFTGHYRSLPGITAKLEALVRE